MLEAAYEKAQQVLLDRTVFALDVKTFKRFTDMSAELRAHVHPLVQQEALSFKQMLVLFAPRTVDVPG